MSRLYSLTLIALAASLGPASADLQVPLKGGAAPRAGTSPKPLSSAPQPRRTAAEAVASRARQNTPLGARSMPRQVGVVRRRGAPPVLPPADGSVPDVPPQAPKAEQLEVNARLGRIVAATVDAYRFPDPRTAWVSKLKAGQQVAIVSQWQGWFAIVMGDGSQAYVPQTHVEVLPYQVKSVVKQAPQPVSPPAAGGASLASFNTAFQGPNLELVRAVIEEARRYEGVRYVYGGNTESGIDCSGLVRNCFAAQGISLPRRASEQALVGSDVPLDQLQPGDRLYFSVKKQWDHTGIYVGDGYFIHASRSRGKVAVDHLSTRLYGNNLTAARRL